MFSELKEWIESLLGTEYQYPLGQWVENPELGFACVIIGNGGSPVDMDIRRPRFKVMLLGPREQRYQAHKIINDIDNLIQLAIDSNPPCGAATIRAVTEPTGPGYTTENRAWVSVDFQIIY